MYISIDDGSPLAEWAKVDSARPISGAKFGPSSFCLRLAPQYVHLQN